MNILTKYESLDPEAKKQAEVFMDFLLAKQKIKPPFDLAKWKKKISDIPQWSDEDLACFEENREHFNNWPTYKW